MIAAFVVFRGNLYVTELVVAAWLVIVIASRRGASPEEIGFTRRGAIKQTAAGFGLGFVCMACIVGWMAAAGWYQVTAVFPNWIALAGAVGFYLVVAFVEETISRGYLLRWIELRIGSLGALGASSLAFGLLHIFNPHATVLAGVAIAVEAGVLLGAAYLLTRRLWLPIGIHWAWNLFEGPVYGTKVSGMTPHGALLRPAVSGPDIWTGGAFGPEAGLVALIVGTVGGLALLAAAARKGRLRGARALASS
jgi:hypothetical protein